MNSKEISDKFDALTKRYAEVLAKRQRREGQITVKRQEFQKILKEIEDMNLKPETMEAEIQRLGEELKSSVADFEKRLNASEAALEAFEVTT